ncbi:protein of unknown function [Burkholderia multivorans]
MSAPAVRTRQPKGLQNAGSK